MWGEWWSEHIIDESILNDIGSPIKGASVGNMDGQLLHNLWLARIEIEAHQTKPFEIRCTLHALCKQLRRKREKNIHL